MRTLYKLQAIWTRFMRVLKLTGLSVVVLVVVVFMALQLPTVQNFIGQQVVQHLEKRLATTITVEDIRFGLFEATLDKATIYDRQQDTLLYAGHAYLQYNAFQLLQGNLYLPDIRLEDASIQVDRPQTDTVFNYQFILDAFSSTDTTSTTSGGMAIYPGTIRLVNVGIAYNDWAGGLVFHQKVGTLTATFEQLDLAQHIIQLQSIAINQPNTTLRLFAASLPNTAPQEMSTAEPAATTAWNPAGWKVSVESLNIADGVFDMQNLLGDTALTPNAINWNNLFVNQLDLSIADFTLRQDTFEATMQDLALREQSGFKLDSMGAAITFSPSAILLQDLLLQTPATKLADEVTFHYNTLDDFNDFVDKVNFAGHFDESTIAVSDLSYFVPSLPLANRNYFLDGVLKGTVDNLRGKDIRLQYGQYTDVMGNFSVYGLPDPQETFIDFSLDYLTTTKGEFESLLPFVQLPDNTRKLGKVRFSGNFTGFLQDFVAYGNLQTAIGNFNSDINLVIDPKTKIPAYSGSLEAVNFNVGQWLENPALGKVSFDAQLSGKGFTRENLDADVATTIHSLTFNDYTYRQVAFDGHIKQRIFEGTLKVKDDNLVMDFKGKVDVNQEVPTFDVSADIGFAQLKPLNLAVSDIKVQTKIEANFSGLSLDNLVGKMVLANTNLYAEGAFYRIGDIALTSENYALGKRISLQSSIADGMIDGQFEVSALAPTFLGYLSQYYPSLLQYTSTTQSEQDFFFYLDIKRGSHITDLFLPNLRGLAGTSLSGNFNSRQHRLIANLTAPNVTYEGFSVKNMDVFMQSSRDTFMFDAIADEFQLPNQLTATHHLSGKIYNNNVFLNLEVFEDSSFNELFANAILTNKGDSLSLQLLSSKLIIAGEPWRIDEKNEIIYHDNNLFANNIVIKNDQQKITLVSAMNRDSLTDLTATLTSVSLGSLLKMAQYDTYAMDGKISGQIVMRNALQMNKDIKAQFGISDFTLEKDTVGQLTAEVRYDLTQSRLEITSDLLATNGGKFAARGMYQPAENDAIQFKLTTSRTPIKVLEPFLAGIASNMTGTIDGEATLSGTIDDPVFQGGLTLQQTALTADYLGTRYYFDPIQVSFTQKSIYVSNTTLYDSQGKNASTADMGGEIFFTGFNDFTFKDFYIYTDPNFKFMSTTAAQNELFYGTAYGKAIVLVNGPFDELDVYVNATTEPKTNVSIPIVYETNVSQYEFIQFVDRSKDTIRADLEAKQYTGMNLTMDLDVTTDAQMNIIFNQQTGEIIQGRGEGNLKLKIDPAGNFAMYGDVRIEEGSYLFRLQDIISKRFILEEGGTISWQGDPYNAQLDLKAIYQKKVARYDLVSDLESQLSNAEIQNLRRPVLVNVGLAMEGSLNNPDISFDISVPNQDQNLTSVFTSRLQEIKTQETELNKQVFGLIIFNQFLPPELAGTGDGDLLSTSTNTLTEFLTNQFNIYFNDWLSKYDISVNFDYRSYNLAESSEDAFQRNELELELNKKIGRLTINVGGNFDFGTNTTNAASANNLYGDFSIEYALTEDGNVRVRGFRETDYDIFAEDYRGRAGVGISFRKEFDTFAELFSTTANTSPKPPKEVSKTTTEDKKEKDELVPPPDLQQSPGPYPPEGPMLPMIDRP